MDQKQVRPSLFIIYLLGAVLWSFAEGQEQSQSRNPILNRKIKEASYLVRDQSGLVKGSGVVYEDEGRLLFSTASHVVRIVCPDRSHGSFQIYQPDSPGNSIQIDCTQVKTPYQGTDADDVSFAILTAKKTGSTPQMRELYERALKAKKTKPSGNEVYHYSTYCWNSPGDKHFPVNAIYDGFFYNTYSNLIPGCSGTGLFDGDQLIGVFRGFHPADKASLFIPIDPKNFEKNIEKKVTPKPSKLPEQTQPATEEKGRNPGVSTDPIDGDPDLSAELVVVLPELPYLPDLNPAARIVQVPEVQDPTQPLPFQLSTRYYKYPGHMSCNAYFGSDRAKRSIGPLDFTKSDTNWPMNLKHVESGDFETQDSYLINPIEKIFVKNNPKRSKPENCNPKTFRPELAGTPDDPRTKDDPVSFLSILHIGEKPVIETSGPYLLNVPNWKQYDLKKPRWKVRVTPGMLAIFDQEVSSSEIVFPDPNICYRSLTLENPVTKKVVNYGITLKANKQPAMFEMAVQRTQAKSFSDLRKGNIEFMEIYNNVRHDRKPKDDRKGYVRSNYYDQ